MRRRLPLVMTALLVAALIVSGGSLAMATGLGTTLNSTPSSQQTTPAGDVKALRPEVIDLALNAMPHDPPDPNESLEAVQLFVESRTAPNPKALLEAGAKRYPDSRHIRARLAQLLWNEYLVTKHPTAASRALDEAAAASRLSAKNGRIEYLWLVSEAGLAAGRQSEVAAVFDDMLAVKPLDYQTHLEYARYLWRVEAPADAELHFQTAINNRPSGNIDAVIAYAERLIDAERYQDAVALLTIPGERMLYGDFLRGVALERTGKTAEALTAYEKYREMSQVFPAPDRYKTESSLQDGIGFASSLSVQAASLSLQGQIDLSWAVACEAGSETAGGMKAMAYATRQRAVKGNDGCVDTGQQGSTLSERYSSVVCYKNSTIYPAYEGVVCSSSSGPVTSCRLPNQNTRTATSDQVAYDVWYGWVPEPAYNWCPGDPAYDGTNACGGTCRYSSTDGVNNITPHSWFGNSICGHTYSCFQSLGFLCGNGDPDNCFYLTK
jgi:hypothetical protein